MTDAEKREKVIRGLEACACNMRLMQCVDCPYHTNKARCITTLMRDALDLLKEQEPRVMTLKELWNVGRVWESSVPPYLWLEKNRSIYNTTSFWVAWRDIYEMIHGRHDKYTDENYGSAWRVWNLQPTQEQRKAVKWDEE